MLFHSTSELPTQGVEHSLFIKEEGFQGEFREDSESLRKLHPTLCYLSIPSLCLLLSILSAPSLKILSPCSGKHKKAEPLSDSD